MSENPTNGSASSMVPQSVRDDYNAWLANGDDVALSHLISHLFSSLEIPNYEEVLKTKGDGASFSTDMGIDSLTLAEILFYTEDLLSIRISNEDVSKLRTIGDLKAYLASHRGECKAK
jgi:acyl carrier protein